MDREKEANLAMNGSIYEPSGSVRRRQRFLQGWNANWLDEFAVFTAVTSFEVVNGGFCKLLPIFCGIRITPLYYVHLRVQ